MIRPLAFRSVDRLTQSEFALWLEGLPADDLHHYELLDGFVVREPPAHWPHGEVAATILALVAHHVREHRLGRVFDSSQGFELATGDTVEPDVSFVSNERWRTLPTPVRGFPRVAPDLVFEVLSPGTRRIDRTRKKRVYERNSVREYVLVDPISSTLEVFRLTDGRYPAGVQLTGDEVFESIVLSGFAFPVVEVFCAD